MMRLGLFACVLVLLGGCAQWIAPPPQPPGSSIEPTVIFRSGDGDFILSCIERTKNMRAKDFRTTYARMAAHLNDGSDEDILRFICLSLNKRADYKQFQQGMTALSRYLDKHADNEDGLRGLQILLRRLEQATVRQWRIKEKLEARIKQLEEQNTQLKQPAAVSSDEEKEQLRQEIERLLAQIQQDNGRIQELQKQIEQLKNIENIIKNRDH